MIKIKRYTRHIQVSLLVIMVFAVGFVFGNLNSISVAAIQDTDAAFEPLWQTFDTIQDRFVDDIPITELIDGAIEGMIESLDDQFSGYMDSDVFASFNQDFEGEISGIGVVIRTIEDTSEIEVVQVLPNAPALAAGVKAGDVFFEVDGQSVIGMSQTELAGIVRGPEGSEVNIVFRRGEDLIDLTITRARFEVPNVEYEVLEGDIGYVSMADFSSVARRQVDAALDEIEVNSLSGLIFDIRSNPGGLLSSAIDMGSLFIEDGIILYEAFGDGSEQELRANGNHYDIDVPIVVLVDELSASASELLAGAMQDRGVATVIGEVTFGKGTVQTIVPLANEGGLRLTIARWLTPNRNWIHEQGVTPDIIVDWDPEDPQAEPDIQLEAAIDFLNSAD